MKCVRTPTAWQRVIHGDQQGLREVATEVIAEHVGEKRALRYALCGCGDLVVAGTEGGHAIVARGCGHRLCPRCQRARGSKIARRCLGWLGREAHGWVYSWTVTQPVVQGESLVQCKKRMDRKMTRFLRLLRRRELRAGFVTVHMVWSKGAGGWHYHCHGVTEHVRGIEPSDILAMWRDATGCDTNEKSGGQCRELLGAGAALGELADDNGNLDFWSEAASAAARAIQYPVRDMLQGVSAWRLGGEERVRECCRELVLDASSWKVHRSLGRWRKPPPPAASTVEVSPADAEKKGPVGEKVTLGTVSQLVRRAQQGDPKAVFIFRQLEGTCRNDSDFGRRFVSFCRWLGGLRGAGDSS